jgi:hypothetical protein
VKEISRQNIVEAVENGAHNIYAIADVFGSDPQFWYLQSLMRGLLADGTLIERYMGPIEIAP